MPESLGIAAALLVSRPTNATTLLAHGNASGAIYSLGYRTCCSDPGQACEVVTPATRSFSFQLNQASGIGGYGYVDTATGFFHFMTGTFSRAGPGYVGTYLNAGLHFDWCGPSRTIACGTRFTATSFSVTDPSAQVSAAVPESSAWAMLIAGIAAVAGVIRRQAGLVTLTTTIRPMNTQSSTRTAVARR